MPKTVLVLTPHPDDAEFYAGGTIARLASEGARVVMAIATDGRKGSYQLASDTLARLRRDEAHAAARVLGTEPPIMLGHPDMELDRLPPGVIVCEDVAFQRHRTLIKAQSTAPTSRIRGGVT